GHEVSSVRDESWTSLTNGALLSQAAERFDALLTADQNIEFQQNLATLPIAVVVLVAESNRLESLEPLVPEVLEALRILKPIFPILEPAESPTRRPGMSLQLAMSGY